MKPRLLVLELWGLGDLVIASPFLRAASERYAVTLLAKPFAADLQSRLWPAISILPFSAPWTMFRGKYNLARWHWTELAGTVSTLRRERFEIAVSARWDPRDHLLMRLSGAPRRLGFARLGTSVLLTEALDSPHTPAHRSTYWASLAVRLQLHLPDHRPRALSSARAHGQILVHTGAGQAVRVWPLDRYRKLLIRLRESGWDVTLACDPKQRDWWMARGEGDVKVPDTIEELLTLIDQTVAFIGNDSGPGHLAAEHGVPTFTIFGPQLPVSFHPLHPQSEWIEGKPCPHKPCFDYCRFSEPYCITRLSEDEVIDRVEQFVAKHIV